MAQVLVDGNPMAQTVTDAQSYDGNGVGVESQGVHGNGVFTTDANGSNGLSADLVKALGSNIIKDQYDDAVVKMGFSSTPMNASMRDMGSKSIKSLVFGYYSIDLRKTDDVVTDAVSAITADQAKRLEPKYTVVKVGDNSIFDKTDVIIFKGVVGYDEQGNAIGKLPLAARVAEKSTTDNSLSVQFLNAKVGISIPAGTQIHILGHAAAEEDASTTPWMSLPEPTQQYMQKFMAQTLISSVYDESNKEVNWTKEDVKETVLQQLIEDIERFYIFGTKSYTFDKNTKLHTRTCAGVLQQMFEGGSPIVTIDPDTITFSDLLDATRTTFIGNTGSNRRYMYSGSAIAPAIWGLQDLTKVVTIKEFNSFGYDFTSLDLMGYKLVYVPHPLLDKMGYSNYSLVIDRQYLQRAVFRSLGETELELQKTGTYDGNSTVFQEISAPLLKYPKAHALWIFEKGARA